MNIKVGTFNLYNLVLPNTKYYGKRQYSLNDYNKKTDWIANQLINMDVGLVGFQEIFHPEALNAAIRKSELFEKGQMITTPASGAHPVVGIASKFPIIEYQAITKFPENALISVPVDGENNLHQLPYSNFSRAVLRAVINVHGKEFVVFVVHLKSKRPKFINDETRENPLDVAKAQTRSLMLRAAEATALRSLLMEDLKNKARPVIVLGDVNDTGLSVTTKIISGEPPHRRYPMDVKRKIWDVLLYHAKDIQARKSYQDFYYTHIHNGHYESLDQIMVSEELVSENPNHIARVSYVSLFNDHLLDQTLTNDRIPNWKSDHGLVVASIELKFTKNTQK
ncbi:MAG: hypothetical protein KAI79_00195 [Bacteroidales bacterium]|nr:hypothetical protein [Bacteroidales bacterium]